MATAEGTAQLLQAALQRGLLHPSNVRNLGAGLRSAAVGFGAYRIGGGSDEAAHARAVRLCLQRGVNLIDTSSHYSAPSTSGPATAGHGASERLLGRILSEALQAKEVEREGVIICTKLGHVERGRQRPPNAVPVGGEGGSADDWHCIEKDFVEAEVRASRDRLGLVPDLVLLHNPEYFLSAQLRQSVPIADAWDEMYLRLRDAFERLEDLCDEGVIAHGYGVSSNFLSCLFSTTGRPNLYEALVADRVLDVARAVARKTGRAEHRLRLIQLPLNAFESGAVLGRGSVIPEAAEGDCHVASRLGMAVVTNRPLHMIPMPEVTTGDWGRTSTSHVKLCETKPIGAMQSLLKRVLVEALYKEEEANVVPPPLQQVALRVALSSPGVASTLCGARQESYVEDVSAVLKTSPYTVEQVNRAFEAVRAAAEELACQKRGLW